MLAQVVERIRCPLMTSGEVVSASLTRAFILGFMEEEFGGMPIRFLDLSKVKTYDSEGNEIKIPKCKACNAYMNEVFGQTHCTWVCLCRVNGCEPKKL